MKISCPKLLGSSSSPCKMKRKKEKQKAEIDARAAEVYTCGPCCRSAGSSFRCSVPIAQREWSLWKLLLRFPFLLSEPSALVGGSGLRMVKRTSSLEQRSDWARRRWWVMWNSEENPGDIGWFKPFKSFQFDAIFVYSKQQQNQGEGVAIF